MHWGAACRNKDAGGTPPRERGRLARMELGRMERTLQRWVRRTLQRIGRGWEAACRNKDAGGTPPRERGRLARMELGRMERTLQRWVRRTLQRIGHGWEVACRNKDAGGTPALPGGCGRDARAPGGMRAGRPRSRGDEGFRLPFPTPSPGPTGSGRCFAAWPGRWRGRSSAFPARSTCWRRPRRAPAGRRACPRPGTPPGFA